MSLFDETILDLARPSGFVTARAVRERGIAPVYLQRLAMRGVLTRVSRGVYELADNARVTEWHHWSRRACACPPV